MRRPLQVYVNDDSGGSRGEMLNTFQMIKSICRWITSVKSTVSHKSSLSEHVTLLLAVS